MAECFVATIAGHRVNHSAKVPCDWLLTIMLFYKYIVVTKEKRGSAGSIMVGNETCEVRRGIFGTEK
jgi:hypothetical protein